MVLTQAELYRLNVQKSSSPRVYPALLPCLQPLPLLDVPLHQSWFLVWSVIRFAENLSRTEIGVHKLGVGRIPAAASEHPHSPAPAVFLPASFFPSDKFLTFNFISPAPSMIALGSSLSL